LVGRHGAVWRRVERILVHGPHVHAFRSDCHRR
jgi:hypothetical protein